MEKAMTIESLINELSQGKELVEELMNQSCSQEEKRLLLVSQIISSYEKSLLMLNHRRTSPDTGALDESPNSPANVSKRRKAMTKWSEQIKVGLGGGGEGALDDGYSWRKYGQKQILGSAHPRGYYRCTFRPSQGCLATKQVQRSDQDASIFEVTYKGRHTCRPRSSHQARLAQQGANFRKLEEIQKTPTHAQSTLLELKPSLRVKAEDLDAAEGNIFLPPSSFSSSSTDSETLDNPFLSKAVMESGFGDEFSLPFSSPADSDSNNLSDLSELISLPASPVGDNYYSDVKIDKVDFGFNFDFDGHEFFC